MARAELERVLDYILNKADEEEFRVVLKACERRGRDRGAFAALGSTSSGALASKVAADIQERMGASMESIRGTVRGFVADIIRKEAPEVSEAELSALLEAYVPDPASKPAADPMASELPPEALRDMALAFVEYSQGQMAPSRQEQLWSQMPRWQEAYWKAFPPALKAIVKGYLDGRLDAETFGTALLSLLGL